MVIAPRSSSLGNITKFSSAQEFTGKYGETALRFYLLEVARELLPNERIQVCWRYPLPARKTVEIIYSEDRQCARTNGTMKCGSGWVCPACMRYIAQQRRIELETAMKRANSDLFTIMLTFTARHTMADRLKPLLSSMVSAYGDVFKGRWWTMVKEEYMVRGAIRATEITYGQNGWHPHFHVIWFVDKSMMDDNYAGSPDEYATSVYNQVGTRWLEMLEKHGLTGSNAAAFDVRTANDDIADYVSKFGRMPHEWTSNVSAYEVASAVTKKARGGGLSVLDILFNAGNEKFYEGLFKEYHEATKGRSALQWSQGLKKRLDIEVIRDEIAAQGVETETDRLLAEIPISEWRFLANNGLLGQVMTIANNGDEKRLKRLLTRVRAIYENSTIDLSGFDVKGLG